MTLISWRRRSLTDGKMGAMSKTTVTIHSCDICGTDPASTWRLTPSGGDMREIDLCHEHAKPVLTLYKKGRGRRKVEPDLVLEPRQGTRRLRGVV